ncbi:hypothetical protein B0533_08380 [Sedimentibacter sp. SX930]|nr:hypothetical protein B0533_08380 [Sedimentibacter sp. SX930]
MTTFARKLKSQGCTWALLGATAVALGTATAPPVAAEENGTQNYVQILSTQEVSYTAIVTRGTDAINTKPWGTAGFQTISSSQTYLGTEVTVTQEQVADNGVTWALISMDGQEIGWIAKTALTPGSYAKAVSTNTVDYPATITRDTDAINTQPWGAKGYQTVTSSSTYYGKTVTVSQEKVMDYGVTWALVSLDGKELGWIAKDALKAQTYAAIVSEKTVEYSATINRATDAINKAPWGTKGFQTIASSATYVGKTVEVTKEQTTDYGVTWAQISLNGEVLGWIAKDALKVQTYAQITKETAVSYDAIVNRDSDAINTAPWGVKGYQTLSSSAAYVGQTVEVTKEQVTDYGVTWALVSLNGKELGWVAKDALSIKTYAKVVSEKAVAYDAVISRGTDAINTAPWGTKGYTTVASSAGYVGKTVAVSKEQVTDYGVTWALVTLDGKELGWIAKDALKVQTYAQIVKETAVDYYAVISRGTDAINTAPWGIKGFKTVASSADYLGKTVKVSKEQVTDYGVTWVLVSLDGKELGWIAKEGLNKRTDVIEVRQETVTDVIPFTSTIEIDSTKVNTYEAVKQEGVAGVTETVYNVTYVNGVKTTSVVASTNVVKEMVAEIIVKGDQPVITYSGEYTANENEVDFPILYIENAELAVGVENIISAGTKGYELVTYKDKLSDGVKVDTVEVSRTKVQAVRQVVEVGTKVVEEAPTTPQTAEQLQATIDMTLLNNEFLTLVNELRTSIGRAEFTYDATIQDESDQRVADEVSALDFYAPNLGMDHTRPDGSPYYSLLDPEKSSAENLLLNTLSASGETFSVDEKELATLMFNQWKASNGHYANMVDPELNANAVSVQLVDKDGWLVYVASDLLVFNSNW